MEYKAAAVAQPPLLRIDCSSEGPDSAQPSSSRHPEAEDMPPPAEPAAFQHPELADTDSNDASSSASSSNSAVPDSLPLLGSDTDWRAFRARLVASSKVRVRGVLLCLRHAVA